MIRITGAVLLLVFLISLAQPVTARPPYLEIFRADPMRRSDVDGCAVCHVNPEGGGVRNEFGSAFEAAQHTITPMIRAGFPDRFGFSSTRLIDGSAFYFSDPENETVVFERNEEKFLIDLAAIVSEAEEEEVIPLGNSMSFFITSTGPGNGAHLEGLAGADRHCQALGETVGVGDRTWRAYLSTSFQDRPTVNAGDRIGTGPWYNAKGVMIARGVAELHSNNRLTKETALNEKGEVINGREDDPNRHDIMTGTLVDGTAAVGMNCSNWTSSREGTAMVGHHDRQGGGDDGTSWIAAHESRGCSQEDLQASGGNGLFMCFAID